MCGEIDPKGDVSDEQKHHIRGSTYKWPDSGATTRLRPPKTAGSDVQMPVEMR